MSIYACGSPCWATGERYILGMSARSVSHQCGGAWGIYTPLHEQGMQPGHQWHQQWQMNVYASAHTGRPVFSVDSAN